MRGMLFRRSCALAPVVAALLAAGCPDAPANDNNSVDDDDDVPGVDPVVVDHLKDVDVGTTALARLSHRELIDTVRALTGVDATALIGGLPADALTPFDNDADSQLGSLALVEGLSSASFAIADEALARNGGGNGGGGTAGAFRVVAEAEDAAHHVARAEGEQIFTRDGLVAPGDGFVVFLGEAGVRVAVDVDAAHAGAFVVTARGQGEEAAADVPVAEVRVDGAVVDVVEFPGGGVTVVDVDIALDVGAHVVDVVFANDYYEPDTGIDRNLALDFVAVAAVVADDVDVDVDGGAGPADATALLGCAPTGPDDSVCFVDFVETFGRRALRRPLTTDEVAGYAALQQFAIDEGDFNEGARLVIAAMLQDFEFLYRVEAIDTGTAVGAAGDLDDYAVASRLSFLLWGQGPDDALLDAAGRGELLSKSGRVAQAQRLLADPRARARVARLHALWLGTEDALTRVPDTLAPSMAREASALVARVLFDERRPWTDLFTDESAFVDDVLAAHYGLPPLPVPATPSLVSLSGTGRAGLLGQGAFLAVGNKFDDTSPTQRGKALRARLLCEEIPSPTPEDLDGQAVNTDMPPEGAGCKRDRYAAHATGNCAGCHAMMDPIGFGLEQYDKFGRFRTEEPTSVPGACPIDGAGDVDGAAFSGPAALGRVLLDNPGFTHCFSRQFLRSTWARQDAITDEDDINAFNEAFAAADYDFVDVVTAIAAGDAFARRVMPAPRDD